MVMTLRVLLPILCLATVIFIFSNSLQTATNSSKQSSTVVAAIQDVASVIAPDSKIATATGEAYDKLHNFVRKLAHFSEFALLGALLCWTYFSYSDEKRGLYIPALVFVCIPCIDEGLQLFVQGRGASATDVLLDCFGGACGFLFAFLVALGIQRILKRKNNKNDSENTD